jgi:CheY-like chemotaxis protein
VQALNVIYIDDDATNRALLKEMLSLEGIDMHEAADGLTGLKMIGDGDYDLIFMDLRMPNLNGLTAIRQLRSAPQGTKRVPIIVVTADPSEGVKQLCRGAGADDFLDKPVSLDRLLGLVAKFSSPTQRSTAKG